MAHSLSIEHNASLWQARRDSVVTPRPNDHRDPFQKDRGRILHAAAFRRLQAKTQIHGVRINDFYRTRLTHSLEVAQIGSGICAQLRQKYPQLASAIASDSLIETLGLAHDLGHPPFGHGGEMALNFAMSQFGGFEGNAQTLRIASKLEPYSEHHGMNLTRRTLLGLLKYPQLIPASQPQPTMQNGEFIKSKANKPVKGIYQHDRDVFDWITAGFTASQSDWFTQAVDYRTVTKSLDCSMMELADDIAYAVHDLEDAIVTEHIHRDDWQSQALPALAAINCNGFPELAKLSDALFSASHYQRKQAIGSLVNYFVTSSELHPVYDSGIALLDWQAELPEGPKRALNTLKHFVFERVISRFDLQRAEFKGQNVVLKLFTAFLQEPTRLLPHNSKQRFLNAEDDSLRARVICDYLSGMTDEYAHRTYQSMFG